MELIADQQQSGHSVLTYCALKRIKPATFQYWLRKCRQAEDNHKPCFIPIEPPALSRPGTSVSLSYPNGVCIHLSQPDLGLISQLVQLV